jgi:zinc protease
MTFRLRLRGVAVLLAVALGSTLVVAGQSLTTPGIQTAPLTARVPLDPELTQGTLANGLRYYIRPNQNPQNRAELRLVVRAGSVLEDDDQRGFAHFVEHLAFRGTTDFPDDGVLAFLTSVGIGIGPDANAETSFDETVYKLLVPTDRPGTIDRSLDILENFAHEVTFEPSAIDAERAVVLEEWRLNRGAGARTQDKELPVLLMGSRYADRTPIGTPETIQAATRERIVQFYKDWYRPDLMAVIAVGDIDPASVEQAIKARFGPLTSPRPERPRPEHDLPDHPGTVYIRTSDPEAQATTVEVSTLNPLQEQITVGGYKRQVLEQYYTGMLSARYAELAQQPQAPIVAAEADAQMFFTRTRTDLSVGALVKEGDIQMGLEALMTEVARASKFGFTADELERQKQGALRGYERAVTGKASRTSESRADEYIRNFLEQEPLPSIEDEYALQQRFSREITLADINALAKTWLPNRNRFVVIRAPGGSQAIPTERALDTILAKVSSAPLTPYVDTVTSAKLLDTLPTPGTIVKSSTRADIGLTEWTLSNGVTVALRPMMVHDDAVVMRASSPGGTSLASDADYIPASVADTVIGASGVGKFSDLELNRILTGKVAAVSPRFDELSSGLVGTASTKDLETLFQLTYLRFTQPRADPALATVAASQLKAMLANQSSSPEWLFNQAITSAMTGDNPRRRLTEPSSIDSWDLDKSLAFYKARFADAGNFTFVFAGDFDLDTMKPLVERYLGSLPSLPTRETWKDLGIRAPTGVVEKTVEKGFEPKSEVALVFHGPFQYDPLHRAALDAVSSILQSDLFDTIRSQLGGTYDISSSVDVDKIPVPTYTLTVQWTCDPQRVDALVASVQREIADIRTRGISGAGVLQIRRSLLRRFETNIQQKGFVAGRISQSYELGEDPGAVWALPDVYGQLTGPMIEEAARTYLDGTYVKVVLMPEKR